MPRLVHFTLFAGLYLLCGLNPSVRAEDKRIAVTVLPLPSKNVPPPIQDAILAHLARQLRTQFSARVLSGRAVGRSVWGTLGSGLEEAAMRFTSKVAEGRRAYQLLQVGKTLKVMEEAKAWEQYCGSELRDIQDIVDLHVYTGLALLAQGQKEQAAAEFRRAVSYDPELELSPKKFPPDVVQAFKEVKQVVLSRPPTLVSYVSRPQGATIYIDGKRRGKTNATGIPLYPGQHFVRLELEGYSTWTLNLPDRTHPAQLKALMVPLWTGDPPEELLARAIATENFDEVELAQLRLLAGFFRADALVLALVSQEEGNYHLGTRLFVVRPEIVTRARLFNLGTDLELFDTKIQGVVSTLKGPLTRANRDITPTAVLPVKPVKPVLPAVHAGDPGGPVSRVAFPTAQTIIDPHDDYREEEDNRFTPWYESWWFWTAVGVVVAGSGTALTIWLLQPDDAWTLVVQPQQ